MDDSKIEWTDATWNPVRGCSRVSPGCDHCYAMRQAHRHSGAGRPYAGLTTIRRGKVDWAGMARLIPGSLDQPLRWKRPRKIFVNSMSDLFHESLKFEEIAAVFGVMAACTQHTFQVLTKRPTRALEFFEWLKSIPRSGGGCDLTVHTLKCYPWPLPNVWLGCSAENQEQADKRIPLLLQCPAAVRFVSAEPLLSGLDLSPWLGERCPRNCDITFNESDCDQCHGAGWIVPPEIDWVIVGGESGNGARPCDVSWIRNIVHDCNEAGVACFCKQMGSAPFDSSASDSEHLWETSHDPEVGSSTLAEVASLAPVKFLHKKGGDPEEWENYLRVRQFPTEARS